MPNFCMYNGLKDVRRLLGVDLTAALGSSTARIVAGVLLTLSLAVRAEHVRALEAIALLSAVRADERGEPHPMYGGQGQRALAAEVHAYLVAAGLVYNG